MWLRIEYYGRAVRIGGQVYAILAVGLFSAPAAARAPRVNQIPNGAVRDCSTCHQLPGTNGPRNIFGISVELTLIGGGSSGRVDWQARFNLDSDSDGYSNGQELGDPCGAWGPGRTPGRRHE